MYPTVYLQFNNNECYKKELTLIDHANMYVRIQRTFYALQFSSSAKSQHKGQKVVILFI